MPYDIAEGRRPKGDNLHGALETFHERKYYSEFVKDDLGGFIDMLSSNRRNYGRLDKFQNKIFPSEAFLKLVKDTDDVFLMSYVAEAYNDFYEYLQLKIKQKKVYQKSSFLPSMKPVRGWQSITAMHLKHMERFYDAFAKYYTKFPQERRKITSFETFADALLDFYQSFLGTINFTFNSYVTSRVVDPRFTGLIVDHQDIGFSKDRDKAKWLEDKNFGFYLKAAKAHGFLVDKNAPWRLVFNINSRKALPYMENFSTDSTTVFESTFHDVLSVDYSIFKRFVIAFYNSFVDLRPLERYLSLDSKGKLCSKFMQRDKVVENILSKDEEKLGLEIYFRFLLTESGKSDRLLEEFNQHVQHAQLFERTRGNTAGSRYLNFVNKRA